MDNCPVGLVPGDGTGSDDQTGRSVLNDSNAQTKAPDSKPRKSKGLVARSSLATAPARLRHRLRRMLSRRGRAAPSATRHNERVLYAEAATQAVSMAGAMSFISVFLVRLGAPNWLVGLYISLPALVLMLTVLPMGSFVQRRRSLAATANWGRMLFRSMVALFGLLPFLPPTIAPFVLVGARGLMAMPGSAFNIAFTTILGKATSPERRLQMLSMRRALNGLVAVPVGLLAGYWLDYAPYPLNYQMLFLSAFVVGILSVYILSRLDLGATPQDEERRKERGGLREMLLIIKGTPAFRNYAVAAFLFRLGMSMPTALYTIYRVRTLGVSDSWIGVLLTVERLVGVVAYFALGRLLTRRKYRRWLWLSCTGAALYPFTMALARTPEMLLVPAVMGGIFGAGTNLFLTNLLFRVSPEEQRPTFVAANSFLTNLAAFVAPMLGTALADVTTIGFVLMLTAGLRALASMAFRRLRVVADQ